MTEQISLRLPKDLEKLARQYVKKYGYKNIQEFVKETLRAKVYGGAIDDKKILKQTKFRLRKKFHKK